MAFSAHEVLEESWTLSKRTYWAWWPVIIVAVLVPFVLQIISTLLTGWASNLDGFFGDLFDGYFCNHESELNTGRTSAGQQPASPGRTYSAYLG